MGSKLGREVRLMKRISQLVAHSLEAHRVVPLPQAQQRQQRHSASMR